MTKAEALTKLIGSFAVAAHAIIVDYDPGAGSTYEYKPVQADVEVLAALAGRPIHRDTDLHMCSGIYGGQREYYVATKNLKREIVEAVFS